MNLFDLDTRLIALSDAIEAAGGEVTDEQDAEFDALLGSREQKADGYGALIRTMEARAEAYGREGARFSAKKTAAENTAKRLKSRVLQSMQRTGDTELNGRLFKIRRQRKVSKAVCLNDGVLLSSVPERFLTAPTLATAALAAALKDGDEQAASIASVVTTESEFARLY